MIRLTSNTNKQLVVYAAPLRPTDRPEAPIPDALSDASSLENYETCESEPAEATISERANFLVGRLWTRLVKAEHLKGMKHGVHRLPPPDWYSRFTSDNHVTRVAAYWENRHHKLGSIWLTNWEQFTNCLLRFEHTEDIIELHLVLSKLFGDIGYEEMVAKASSIEKKLAPGRIKRHYVARILSKSYTSTDAFPGWCHEREAGFIRGTVDGIREMYQSICICLQKPRIVRKLALVPRTYYEEFLMIKNAGPCSFGAHRGANNSLRPYSLEKLTGFFIRAKQALFGAQPSHEWGLHALGQRFNRFINHLITITTALSSSLRSYFRP